MKMTNTKIIHSDLGTSIHNVKKITLSKIKRMTTEYNKIFFISELTIETKSEKFIFDLYGDSEKDLFFNI